MATERLTNDYLKFISEIEIELKRPIPETPIFKPKFIYTEFPAIQVDRFAIHYLTSDIDKLVLRRWNWHFDIQKGQLGVWNLDRVAIAESSVDLNKEESEKINTYLLKPFTIKALEGIVLDGINYSFTSFANNEQSYQWRVNTQLETETINFLSYLKHLTGTGN